MVEAGVMLQPVQCCRMLGHGGALLHHNSSS